MNKNAVLPAMLNLAINKDTINGHGFPALSQSILDKFQVIQPNLLFYKSLENAETGSGYQLRKLKRPPYCEMAISQNSLFCLNIYHSNKRDLSLSQTDNTPYTGNSPRPGVLNPG
jgi:hypothetical protein